MSFMGERQWRMESSSITQLLHCSYQSFFREGFCAVVSTVLHVLIFRNVISIDTWFMDLSDSFYLFILSCFLFKIVFRDILELKTFLRFVVEFKQMPVSVPLYVYSFWSKYPFWYMAIFSSKNRFMTLNKDRFSVNIIIRIANFFSEFFLILLVPMI